MAYKSIYKPKFPDKYIGDPNNIVCRSNWERQFCKQLDLNENVLKWASEEIYIRYRCPLTGRPRRYYPDFYVENKTKDNTIKRSIIEIKPHKQTIRPKKQSKRHLQEMRTFIINNSKWDAAKAYCENKGWDFKIITEKQVSFIR